MSPDADAERLEDIREHAQEAMEYLRGVSVAAFRQDRLLRLAIERLLEIIGEGAAGLSDATRARIPYDWRAVRGLRNVIAHQYGSIDPDQLHRVVVNRLPELVAAIQGDRK